ncbi:DUF371 domain-containing protein [Actinokineospora bangkokensis]|uniref:DUF371 domain-containing protein n=1 Tax=Actinokineospora bangkokensis TaxID=1193682 RepID=A0A1Q9LBY2_9PSEU|nr:DUF371 domain-containing protein [Actinokineospora bangkokensis]OLR89523.1 hypothetical protein BJP25_05435 [Actinokineospora bangkokensis]
MPGPDLLRLRSRGHPGVRATHDRTLELTTDPDITARATCILGTGTEVVGPVPPAIAGLVDITITAAGHTAVVRALANSAWHPGTTAVVRRSPVRLPNTLATDADTTARDLPRDLVLALSNPDTEITTTITRAHDDTPRLVLFRLGDDRRLLAEVAAADAVVAEDDTARSVLSGLTAAHDALGALSTGARVLAVSSGEGPHPFAAAALSQDDRPEVEVLGLPPELAVASISPHWAPPLITGPQSRRDAAKLAAAHPAARVVFRTPGTSLARALDEAAKTAGTRTAAIGTDERPTWGPITELRTLTPRGDVFCALDPVQSEETAADPSAPEAFITALLSQSVSPTTLVKALSSLPGWSRKQAYDLVLRLNQR